MNALRNPSHISQTQKNYNQMNQPYYQKMYQNNSNNPSIAQSNINQQNSNIANQQLYRKIQQNNQQNYYKSYDRSSLQFGKLNQHNIHVKTDTLYQPLRQTLIHPQRINRNTEQVPQIVRNSYLSSNYTILSPKQAQQIKKNTYIIKNVDLAQTDHFYKVKDIQFVAVNTGQKVIGKPITPLELERIKQQGVRRSMVVYDVKERVQQVDQVTTYVPREINQRQYKAKQYSYNLYSLIDQPMNWIREMGCKGANWCPSNQIVASKNQPQSLKWLK